MAGAQLYLVTVLPAINNSSFSEYLCQWASGIEIFSVGVAGSPVIAPLTAFACCTSLVPNSLSTETRFIPPLSVSIRMHRAPYPLLRFRKLQRLKRSSPKTIICHGLASPAHSQTLYLPTEIDIFVALYASLPGSGFLFLSELQSTAGQHL